MAMALRPRMATWQKSMWNMAIESIEVISLGLLGVPGNFQLDPICIIKLRLTTRSLTPSTIYLIKYPSSHPDGERHFPSVMFFFWYWFIRIWDFQLIWDKGPKHLEGLMGLLFGTVGLLLRWIISQYHLDYWLKKLIKSVFSVSLSMSECFQLFPAYEGWSFLTNKQLLLRPKY